MTRIHYRSNGYGPGAPWLVLVDGVVVGELTNRRDFSGTWDITLGDGWAAEAPNRFNAMRTTEDLLTQGGDQ